MTFHERKLVRTEKLRAFQQKKADRLGEQILELTRKYYKHNGKAIQLNGEAFNTWKITEREKEYE